MRNPLSEPPAEEVALEYELDAPPEKVWRAIAYTQFRNSWLPASSLAEVEPVSAVPGEEICYRMRDDRPPFLESTVTFRIGPGIRGGTRADAGPGPFHERGASAGLGFDNRILSTRGNPDDPAVSLEVSTR
jgi:uncharacterized protein YndB with AHSA1/START domain